MAAPPQTQPRRSAPPAPRPAPRRGVWPLLALPYLALCFPGLYARATPALFGFPFFYWYQFGWVILTSLLLWAVYRLMKSREPIAAEPHDNT